jgi:hypothetical protein
VHAAAAADATAVSDSCPRITAPMMHSAAAGGSRRAISEPQSRRQLAALASPRRDEGCVAPLPGQHGAACAITGDGLENETLSMVPDHRSSAG